MVKKFKIEGIDCANCARELEEKLNKIKGMNSCKISFLAEKVTIDANDDVFVSVLDEAKKIAKRFEDGVVIVSD